MYRADSMQPLPTARQHSLYAYAVLRYQLMLSRQNMLYFKCVCCDLNSMYIGFAPYLCFMLNISENPAVYIISCRSEYFVTLGMMVCSVL